MKQRIIDIWNTPYKRFVVLGIILFISWDVLLYNLILKSSIIDFWVFRIVQNHTIAIINIFSESYLTNNLVIINGQETLKIVKACNGLNFMGVFLSFALSFPRPIISKIIFIPIGLVFIHILNIIRIASLAYIVKHRPELFDIMHSWIFIIIIYGAVLGISLLWINITDIKHENK